MITDDVKMVQRYLISLILLTVISVSVRSQFFDFFDSLRPYTKPQTLRPIIASFGTTTKRPTNRRTTTHRSTFNGDAHTKASREKTRGLDTVLTFITTTVKPNKVRNSGQRNSNVTQSTSKNVEYDKGTTRNDKRIPWYEEGRRESFGEEYILYPDAIGENDYKYDVTKGSNWDNGARLITYPGISLNGNSGTKNNGANKDYIKETNNRKVNKDLVTNLNAGSNVDVNRGSNRRTGSLNKDRGWSTGINYDFSTQNPFGSGVKPASVDENRPPLTNKPVTKRPGFIVFPQSTDSGAAFAKDPDKVADLTIGPDEAQMSSVEKRRYIENSEKMCNKYKALSIKKIEAIPLIPSPEVVSTEVSSCEPISVPLIVGGNVVTIREFPHMALLGWEKVADRGRSAGYFWKCGGSLVSEQHVLTAGHCAYSDRDNRVKVGPPTVVQLGSSYLDDPGALTVKISSIIRHPKYNSSESYYDIAIVKLAHTVTFSDVIKPACLGVPPAVNQPVIATGWGYTQYNGKQSKELRSVSLPIWDIDECRRVLGPSRKLPNGPSSDSQVCAGEKRGGKDTCQGDSGGPIQLQDGCIWRVVAITSVGRSCGAPNTPGLYAKFQIPFISAVVFGTPKNLDNRNTDQPNWNDRNSNPYDQDWNRNSNDYNSNNWNRGSYPQQNQPVVNDLNRAINNVRSNDWNSNQNWNTGQSSGWNTQSYDNNRQRPADTRYNHDYSRADYEYEGVFL